MRRLEKGNRQLAEHEIPKAEPSEDGSGWPLWAKIYVGLWIAALIFGNIRPHQEPAHVEAWPLWGKAAAIVYAVLFFTWPLMLAYVVEWWKRLIP